MNNNVSPVEKTSKEHLADSSNNSPDIKVEDNEEVRSESDLKRKYEDSPLVKNGDLVNGQSKIWEPIEKKIKREDDEKEMEMSVSVVNFLLLIKCNSYCRI